MTRRDACIAALQRLAMVAIAMIIAARGHAAPAPPPAGAALPSVAFYYGPHPPISALQAFDWVVVDGDAALPTSVSGLGPGTPGTTYFGYVSMGEVADSTPASDLPPKACLIARNQSWKSSVLDLRAATCRNWLVHERVDPLIRRGFDHFFLDTLDSYMLALHDPKAREDYRQGIVATIHSIRAQSPDARFMLNRGFELLDALEHDGVVAVAAESLYRGWDPVRQDYVQVKPQDSAWLKARLDEVRARGLVPVAIDYVADGDSAQARATAGRIRADGFVPYVTDAKVDRVGTGAAQPVPREILLLYNGSDSPVSTNVNWNVAMVLNHMGYITRSINVDQEPLPDHDMQDRLAGVVTWFSGDLDRPEPVYAWLRQQMKAGVPVAVLGEFGFPADAQHLLPLGVVPGAPPAPGLKAIHVVSLDTSMVGFESPADPVPDSFTPLSLRQGQPALELQRDGQRESAVAITPWGGFALAPYVVFNLPQGALRKTHIQGRWILDPFVFLRKALRLTDLPAFDTTTASGNRLLFAQIDGDGFTSLSYIPRYHGQTAAKVILEAVLKRYRIPVSAALIAAEFADGGLYTPAQLAVYRPIARDMLALPWVEVGSHTYSHPFDWHALENDPSLSAGLHLDSQAAGTGSMSYVEKPKLKYGYNLPVPGYRFDPETEVAGSVRIINQLLAPPGKHVAIYQWSGDTDPDEHVLDLVYKAGLPNLNGNNSTISEAWPSLTNVSALGVWKGDHFQVYAPDANEDQFTNDWSPPYCGYSKVLQTFRMTDAPRRLAPIDIYYHFYSGTRSCGLQALQTVYQWALRQPTDPVYPSHYSRIVLGFEYAGIGRDGDAFILAGYGADQTVRVDTSAGYPDLSASSNIAGFDDANHARYISLGPGNRARLVLKPMPPEQPYLVAANATVAGLRRSSGALHLELAGHVPLKLSLANTRRCTVRLDGRKAPGTMHGDLRTLTSPESSGHVDVECPR